MHKKTTFSLKNPHPFYNLYLENSNPKRVINFERFKSTSSTVNNKFIAGIIRDVKDSFYIKLYPINYLLELQKLGVVQIGHFLQIG